MKRLVGLLAFFVSSLVQVNSQYNAVSYGQCCTSHFYQIPGSCCSHPCCVQTTVPVTCCQTREVMVLRLTLKTYEPWKTGYADPSSSDYKAFVAKFIAAVKKAYVGSELSKNVEVRVNKLESAPTIQVTFVLAYRWRDPYPLKPLRIAIGTGFVPNPKDAGRVKIYPMLLTLVDKVLHVRPVIYLDTKPIVKQQTDEEMENAIFNYINSKRPVHLAPLFKRAVFSDKPTSKEWAEALKAKQKIEYSPLRDKKRSENLYIGCIRPGEYLNGEKIGERWYSTVSTYFSTKVTLAAKLKAALTFINIMYKASTQIDIKVVHYTRKDNYKCFIAIAFVKNMALTQTAKQLVANILRGKYKVTKRDVIAHPGSEIMDEMIL